MPIYGEMDHLSGFRRFQQDRETVRKKYPDLIEGSSGWYRAMANQKKKRSGCRV